jgi:pyruvate,orthophosphate dikinase
VPEGHGRALRAYKEVYRKHVGDPFPQDPFKQLELPIEAVFKSWDAPRAKSYRRIGGITGLNGTAVNVQAMVYGNMGETRARASRSRATRRRARTSSTASS